MKPTHGASIPARLLIHSVWHAPYLPDDFAGPAWGEEILVERVRVEPSFRVVTTQDGQSVQCDTVLFVDGRLSTQVAWKEKDHVRFGEREMQVRRIDAHYDQRSDVHHLEVTLV